MRRLEVVGLLVALLVIMGTPAAAFGYENYLRSKMPNELTISGENGEWSRETIRVHQGQPVRPRLTSADVMHSFAIEGLEVPVNEIHRACYTWLGAGGH